MSYSQDIKNEIAASKLVCSDCLEAMQYGMQGEIISFENNCCAISYLKGLFLNYGTVTNPNKEYHLEFNLKSEEVANFIFEILDEFELKITLVNRKGHYIVYTKDSQTIEDIFTILGAKNATLELINLKIEKEIRNNANRATNCETANIDKTVNAAQEQIQRINKIGLENLSESVRYVAKARLLHPEMSLNELSELLNMSRSTINYRLKKGLNR